MIVIDVDGLPWVEEGDLRVVRDFKIPAGTVLKDPAYFVKDTREPLFAEHGDTINGTRKRR